MTKKHQPQAHFPVALFKLDPANIGYDNGKRYRIDTVDETCFYFLTAEPSLLGCQDKRQHTDAFAFMGQHGLRHIEAAEIDKLRKAMQAKPEEWAPDTDIEDEGPIA